MEAPGWSKAIFLSWIVEIRRHPLTGIGGLAAGSAYLSLTSALDRVSQNRHSIVAASPDWHRWGSVLFGILGLPLLIYLMGKLQAPHKQGGVFIFSFFGGAVLA